MPDTYTRVSATRNILLLVDSDVVGWKKSATLTITHPYIIFMPFRNWFAPYLHRGKFSEIFIGISRDLWPRHISAEHRRDIIIIIK